MAEEKENNKKRNVLLIIVFVLLILSILFASSYAYFKVGVVNNFGNSEVASSIACFDISYSETNVIDLENKYPITDEYAMTDNHLTPVTVTVTNNCTNNNNSIDYVLTYTSLSDSDNYIPDNKMRIAVKRKVGKYSEFTSLTPSYVSDLESLTSGTTYNILMNDLSTRQNVSSFPNKVNYVLDRNTIEAGTTNTYKVYMWIDYYEGDTTHEGLNNNSTQNKDYKSALSVVVNSEANNNSALYWTSGEFGKTITTENATKVDDYNTLNEKYFVREDKSKTDLCAIYNNNLVCINPLDYDFANDAEGALMDVYSRLTDAGASCTTDYKSQGYYLVCGETSIPNMNDWSTLNQMLFIAGQTEFTMGELFASCKMSYAGVASCYVD